MATGRILFPWAVVVVVCISFLWLNTAEENDYHRPMNSLVPLRSLILSCFLPAEEMI